MNKKEVTILTEQVEREFLPFVRKPSRYIGGEINQIQKDLGRCELTAALCFPDVYEVGASYLGMAIIYDILNKIEGVAAERVFARGSRGLFPPRPNPITYPARLKDPPVCLLARAVW